MTTVAGGLGTTTAGSLDATGVNAGFNGLQGLCLDPTGTWLGVVDSQNHKIRKMMLGSYVVTTYAGCAGACAAYAVGTPPGPLIDGVGTNAKFAYPLHCGFDPLGNMYVSEFSNPATGSKIRRIAPGGVVSTLAGNGTVGSSDGTGTNALFSSIRGIVVEPTGTYLYAADYGYNVIKRVALATGVVTTLMGKAQTAYSSATIDGTGTSATIAVPCGLAMDPNGMIFATDQNSNVSALARAQAHAHVRVCAHTHPDPRTLP